MSPALSTKQARPPRAHWLPGPSKPWSPSSVVCFDTETIEHRDGDDLVLTPRCWDAVWRLRHEVCPSLPRLRTYAGELMSELGQRVDEIARMTPETWVFAHNLGFDLSVSALPWQLDQHGWQLDACSLTGESTWWTFRADGHRLVLTDSWSWLRADLQTIARDMRRRKVRLPENDDSLAAWHKRCMVDARLLDEAIVTILDWWDDAGLGRFGITGAGCGFAAARAVMGPKKIVVGGDPDRIAFERSAVYGGKKECYRVGTYEGTWCADYDFADAYPTVAAHLPLPFAAGRRFTTRTAPAWREVTPGHDVIARFLVTTETPCVPVKVADETYWPVGRFETVLAGPEARYALTCGAEVEMIDGWAYRTGYPLADWAGWLFALRYDYSADVPAVVRRMAKGWGRSVVGRFASRTSRVSITRPSTVPGWQLSTGHNLTTGRAVDVLSLGGVEYTLDKDLEPEHSFPAILAFVEAYTRVALGKMIASRQPCRVLACNTDGWLEHRAVRSTAYVVPDVPWPFSVVRKGCWRSVEVLGPSHLIMPTERRLAGISKQASEAAGHVYAWHDWPSLRWQLERSVMGEFRRPAHDAVLAGNYARRWVLVTGETVPVAAEIDESGSTVILPWSETPGRRETDTLAPGQYGALEALRGEEPYPPVILEQLHTEQLGRAGRITPPRSLRPRQRLAH